MTTLKTKAEALVEQEKAQKMRERAARQAAKRMVDPVEIPVVECTVLPAGDGKISMGEHVPGLGEAHYEEGETFKIELPVALNLYRRNLVNFEGAKAALQEDEEARRRAEMAALAEDIALRRMVENAEARLAR